ERIGRSDIELSLLACHAIDRELRVPLVLGVALPKGDRQRWLVEKAVELGVARVEPLQTERAISTPDSKLRTAVIAASKQCGRNPLMEIGPPRSFGEFLSASPDGAVRLLADPEAEDCQAVLEMQLAGGMTPTRVDLAIGPE